MASQKEQPGGASTWSLGERVMFAVLMLPALAAVAMVAWCVVAAVVPDLLPLWVAVPVGALLGVGAVWCGTAMSGTDIMDMVVASVMIVILASILLPAFEKMKERRSRKRPAAPTLMQKAREKTP